MDAAGSTRAAFLFAAHIAINHQHRLVQPN
jgi:hypothetical protein